MTRVEAVLLHPTPFPSMLPSPLHFRDHSPLPGVGELGLQWTSQQSILTSKCLIYLAKRRTQNGISSSKSSKLPGLGAP